jgi:predicted Zn-dependent protease
MLSLVLNGCGSLSQPVPVEDRVSTDAERAGTEAAPGESGMRTEPALGRDATAEDTSPAVIAMLDEADAQLRAGRDAAALSSLERALTLEPKNAYLWHRLAALRLQQRDWQQAYVLANKSNSLVRDNPALKIRNWEIIRTAKQRQGDIRGAEEAQRAIRQLSEE